MTTTDPFGDRTAYHRAALARLALSAEARYLAHRAEGCVTTGTDQVAEPGDLVGEAAVMVAAAEQVMTRAVVYERARGTSWEAIAERLGIQRQSAHKRWSPAVAAWREALHQTDPVLLHEAVAFPTDTARSLDSWAAERGHGEHAVSGGLPTLTTAEEMVQVLDALRHLYRDMHTRLDPAAHAALLDRKAALLDRIAAEDGDPEAAEQAAEARARAAQLRTDQE